MSALKAPIDGATLGKVAVLMGGSSAEREISLLSGQGVLAALQSRGVDAHAFDPQKTPLWDLKAQAYKRCFIALHGRHGEDGTVQGALELMGIPYTGSGVMASSLAVDKVMTKRIWAAQGLATPESVVLSPIDRNAIHIDDLVGKLGLPFIVKPPHEGSSIGVSKVLHAGQARAALELAARYDRDVLCETFIQGAELTCAIIGSGPDARALPIVQIEAPEGAYDYQNKYFTDVVRYHCPSGLPAQEEQSIQTLVLDAYHALGCRGWGRADVMVRESDRQTFLLEMNTSPGMTSHSLVPMAARAAGISYEDLCLLIIGQATLDASNTGGQHA